MKSCAEHIESCIQEVQEIYEAVDVLAYSRDKAVLDTLGIESSSSSSSESSGDEIDFQESGLEYKYPTDGGTSNGRVPDQSVLGQVLCDTWFEFREKIECTMEHSDSCEIAECLEDFFLQVPHLNLTKHQIEQTVLSHRAFKAAESESYKQGRITKSVNGQVVSDSESDDAEQYVGLQSIASTAGRELVRKKCRTIRRRCRRLRAKAVAERRFLLRKLSKRTSKILQDCPNIGETIESFVKDHQVGADAWRPTGVLTFDENSKLKVKVTYRKLQEHLQLVYNRKIAFGSVVELCVPHNKRSRSSKSSTYVQNPRRCHKTQVNCYPCADASAQYYPRARGDAISY